jgi:putative ABC transport system permease protein
MLRLLRLLGARRLAHQGAGRAVLAVCGIALGVALGYGVQLVNRAAVADLAASVRELSGGVDLEVRGGRSGFPDALYTQAARVPGVQAVAPGLELEVALAGSERLVRIQGVDVLRQPALVADPRLRAELLAGDKAVLSQALYDRLGGAPLRLLVAGRVVSFEVAGAVPLKGEVALLDIASAQWRLDRPGTLNRLGVRIARGESAAAVRERLAALVPPGTTVSRVEDLEEASAYPSRAYRVNMDVLALVALFTGAFLVFSAQALEAARRRGEHALLRVLGLTRGALLRLVLGEAALLGVLGGLLGLAAGYALALAAVAAFGADLGSGAFRGFAPALRFAVWPAVLYLCAGVAVALLGALLPALDAARSAPARALKAGDEQSLVAHVSAAWPGLALIAAGAALSQLGPVRGLPLFGYLSIACLLLGAVAVMPRAAAAFFAWLPLPRQVPAALAIAQLRGAPGQAAVSLAAIVASFSLMAAMAIMVSSFRASLDDWLNAVLPAELYVRSSFAGDTGYLEAGFAERVRALPQVARVDFLRAARVQLDPSRPPVAVIARDRAAVAFPVFGKRYARTPADPPALWASEALADLYGFAPGERVTIPLEGRQREFVVIGIFRDYARQHGAVLIDREDYVALTGDRRVNDAALWLAPGASVAEAMDALRRLPGGDTLELSLPGEIRRVSLRIFDRSFAVTYAMEALAVLVGLFGLSSSLAAIVLARRREFGMLRHLGVTRAQIGAMLAAEGGLLALLGTLAGLAAGAAISLVLVFVVNRQSFNWSMELHPPYALLGGLAAVVVLLGAATAYASGREATSIGAVRAVRDDW